MDKKDWFTNVDKKRRDDLKLDFFCFYIYQSQKLETK